MSNAVFENRTFTPAEYLTWEETQTERHEYLAGEIRAMSGGSMEHNTIVSNIAGEVRSRLKGTHCRSFTSTQKVQAQSTGFSFFYPDVVIVCGAPQMGLGDAIRNPVAVFEVQSPSTSHYDRNAKFTGYQTIQSLQEYFIVHQKQARVEAYRRTPEGEWDTTSYTVYIGLGATVPLESVGIALPCREIYDLVEITPTPNEDEETSPS